MPDEYISAATQIERLVSGQADKAAAGLYEGKGLCLRKKEQMKTGSFGTNDLVRAEFNAEEQESVATQN
jgi:hypothetical protein